MTEAERTTLCNSLLAMIEDLDKHIEESSRQGTITTKNGGRMVRTRAYLRRARREAQGIAIERNLE